MIDLYPKKHRREVSSRRVDRSRCEPPRVVPPAALAAAVEASRRQGEAAAAVASRPSDAAMQVWLDAIDATELAVRAMWGK